MQKIDPTSVPKAPPTGPGGLEGMPGMGGDGQQKIDPETLQKLLDQMKQQQGSPPPQPITTSPPAPAPKGS